MHLTFLGTGASGGTPGEGRSRRTESSLLVTTADTRLLVDATRDIDEQLGSAPERTATRHAEGPVAEPTAADLDAVVLTHGHRDASGGVPRLRDLRRHDAPPLPVYAAPRTHAALRGRYRALDHVDLVDVAPGERVTVGSVELDPVQVPHADSPRFPTYAWRIAAGSGRTIVYSSDVAELTDELRRHTEGADVLILDGAMYRRSLHTHIRIDEALPVVCKWDVGRIVLTQIGRTAPPHEELVEVAAELCDRAIPASDGMHLEIGDAP
ncbi:MAG: MBL fold metallo-hydrolase [Actinobacteria bacterium]|nr:MBL fold metallo-hydrolase [Actinomycetota bacterium]